MNSVKLNKDLINIVRSYLAISLNNVKRNGKMVLYESKMKHRSIYYMFRHCVICDEPSAELTYINYTLRRLLNWNIINKTVPCGICYPICIEKTKVMDDIRNRKLIL